MRIAYVRVSTVEQNEARQIEALKKYGIEKWFTEKVSGKNTNRPQLQQMLEFAREGDTIYSNPPKYRAVDKYDKIETEVKNNAKQ